jgi:hypothetical protein
MEKLEPKRCADILVRSVCSKKNVGEILTDLDRLGVAADKNVRAPAARDIFASREDLGG